MTEEEKWLEKFSERGAGLLFLLFILLGALGEIDPTASPETKPPTQTQPHKYSEVKYESA